jgi:predicted RNA-binding Zn-ribbon protein involved in translation (DUF1610 family)
MRVTLKKPQFQCPNCGPLPHAILLSKDMKWPYNYLDVTFILEPRVRKYMITIVKCEGEAESMNVMKYLREQIKHVKTAVCPLCGNHIDMPIDFKNNNSLGVSA